MSDDTDQLHFGSDGELTEASDKDESDDQTDFGEPLGRFETKAGYNMFEVSSVLQKAVRRSTEEEAAWAAWELARSGYTTHLWKRLTLFLVEDLAAGQDAALLVERYRKLATEMYEPDEWAGKLCAIHAALTCVRARSSREATFANDYFDKVAKDRAQARAEGRDPRYDFPVPSEELTFGGRYDVVLDRHTRKGKAAGRDWRHFKSVGGRVGPEGEPELSTKWRRRSMEFDADGLREARVAFSDQEIEHALEPVPDSDPWSEPELENETLDSQ